MSLVNNIMQDFKKTRPKKSVNRTIKQPSESLKTAELHSLYRFALLSEHVDPPFTEAQLGNLLQKYKFATSTEGFNLTHYGHRFELNLNNFPVFAELIINGLIDNRTRSLIKFSPCLTLIDISITNVPIGATTQTIKQILKMQGCTLQQDYAIRNETHTVGKKVFKTGRWRVLCYPINGFTRPANNNCCKFFPDRYVIISVKLIPAAHDMLPALISTTVTTISQNTPKLAYAIPVTKAPTRRSATVTKIVKEALKSKTSKNFTKTITKPLVTVTCSKPVMVVDSPSSSVTASTILPRPPLPVAIIHSTEMVTLKTSTKTQTSKLPPSSNPHKPAITQIYCFSTNQQLGVASLLLPKHSKNSEVTIHDQIVTHSQLNPSIKNRPTPINSEVTIHDQIMAQRQIKNHATPLNSPLPSFSTSKSVLTSTVSYIANKTNLDEEPSCKKRKKREVDPATKVNTQSTISVLETQAPVIKEKDLTSLVEIEISTDNSIKENSTVLSTQEGHSDHTDKQTSDRIAGLAISLLDKHPSLIDDSASNCVFVDTPTTLINNSTAYSLPISSSVSIPAVDNPATIDKRSSENDVPTTTVDNAATIDNLSPDNDLLLLSNCVLLKEQFPDEVHFALSPQTEAAEITFNVTNGKSPTVVTSIALPAPKSTYVSETHSNDTLKIINTTVTHSNRTPKRTNTTMTHSYTTPKCMNNTTTESYVTPKSTNTTTTHSYNMSKSNCSTKVSKSTNFDTETDIIDPIKYVNRSENKLLIDVRGKNPVIEIESLPITTSSSNKKNKKKDTSIQIRTSSRLRFPVESDTKRSTRKVVVRSNPIYPPVSIE